MTVARNFRMMSILCPNISGKNLLFPFSSDLNDAYGHFFGPSGNGYYPNIGSGGKWGGNCAVFPSNPAISGGVGGGYTGLRLDSPDFILSGDWTIELWYYYQSFYHGGGWPRIFETRCARSSPNTGGWTLAVVRGNDPSGLSLQQSYGSVGATSANVMNYGWNFIRVGVRNKTCYLQLNGHTDSNTYSSIPAGVYGQMAIGCPWDTNGLGGENLVGSIQDFRYTPGVWLGELPIPTAAFSLS